MPDPVRLLLVLVSWYAACGAAIQYLAAANEPPRPATRPVWLAMLALTVITSGLVLRDPTLASDHWREPGLDRVGEWWRLLFAPGGQDGGVIGTLSDLLGLALVGGVAARLWGPGRWLKQSVGAGLLAAVAAVLWLNPPGAGSAIAVCGLAAGLAGQLYPVFIRPVRVLAIISLAAGLLLLAAGDLHGVAYGAGLALATLTARNRWPWHRPSRRDRAVC